MAMRVCRSIAFIVAVSLDRLVMAVPWDDEKISVGCYHWGWTDQSASSEQAADIDTVQKCVRLCRDSSTCNVFKFIAGTSRCWLGEGTFGERLVKAAEGDLSGPKVCEFPAPACTAKLKTDATFPADSQAAAMRAWTTGIQPQALQCWEKQSSGALSSCEDPVTELGGLEDVKKCAGLTLRAGLNQNQCKATCEADVGCSVWLIRNNQCFTGLGLTCFSGVEVDATAGGRIQHGTSRDIAPMRTKKLSLTSTSVFSKADMDAMGEEKAKERCADTCLSSVQCQFWQLMADTGCHIESNDGLSSVYPLTTAAFQESAGTVIAGEMLQHSCSSQQKTSNPLSKVADSVKKAGKTGSAASGASGASSSSGASSGSGDSLGSGDSSDSSSGSSSDSGSESSGSTWPWWAWLLLALGLLCCCIPVIAGLLFSMGLCDRKEKKKKKKKPVQTAVPVPEPEKASQPVAAVLQPVPVPTTAAPVVTYSAPASETYQVAPVSQAYAAPAAPVQQTYAAPVAPVSQAYAVPVAPVSQTYAAPVAPVSQMYAAPVSQTYAAPGAAVGTLQQR